MELQNLIKKRRSVRRFKQNKISKEELLTISEAACFAHSLGNRQRLRYLLACENKELECIYRHSSLGLISNGEQGLTPLKNAPPVYILICCDHPDSKINFADAGAAFQNMALSALELKISLFWIHAFSSDAIKRDLQLKQDIIAIIALGQPAENPIAIHIDTSEAADYINLDNKHTRTPKFKPSSLISFL